MLAGWAGAIAEGPGWDARAVGQTFAFDVAIFAAQGDKLGK